MKHRVKKILEQFEGKTIYSITECTGPIPCLSLEFKNCWIDIYLGNAPLSGKVSFPVHQIVMKDKETVKARKEQLRWNR